LFRLSELSRRRAAVCTTRASSHPPRGCLVGGRECIRTSPQNRSSHEHLQGKSNFFLAARLTQDTGNVVRPGPKMPVGGAKHFWPSDWKANTRTRGTWTAHMDFHQGLARRSTRLLEIARHVPITALHRRDDEISDRRVTKPYSRNGPGACGGATAGSLYPELLEAVSRKGCLRLANYLDLAGHVSSPFMLKIEDHVITAIVRNFTVRASNQ